MIRSMITIAMVGLLQGCAADTVPGDLAAGESDIDEAPQAVRGEFDVGIIPATTQCPSNSDIIQIQMDDEDRRSLSSVSGWVGASSAGTTFTFCRVDGARFHPLSTINDTKNYYAVLKLGSRCPLESEEFSRYFDNEDRRTRNGFTGDIYPNAVTNNTTLHFCLFRSGTNAMTEFPDLDGVSYGVFASSSFSKAIARGVIHTDDEDKRNQNSYWASSSDVAAAAKQIITDGENTMLYIARVR